MDADISNVGEQFDGHGYNLANDDWDVLATSSLQSYDDPARLSASTTSAALQYPPPPLGSTMLSSYAQQSFNNMAGLLQPTYAAVARRGMQESISATSPASPPALALGDIQRLRRTQTSAVWDDDTRQANYQQFMARIRPQTYAQALRSPQTNQPAPISNEYSAVSLHVQQDFLEGRISNAGQGPSSQESVQYTASAQSGGARAQLAEDSLSTNVNWQLGIAEPFRSIRDWAVQPRATGDRTRPPLKTPLWNQRTEATYQSPVTTSSPTSSSRVGSRRNKGQLQSGSYEYRCNDCGAGFDTTAELNHHSRSHTPYDQRPHHCDSCGARFMYAKDLRRHLPVHDPNAPKHFCTFDLCKYATIGFKREDHLERHLRTHAVDSVQQSPCPSSQQGF